MKKLIIFLLLGLSACCKGVHLNEKEVMEKADKIIERGYKPYPVYCPGINHFFTLDYLVWRVDANVYLGRKRE